MWFLSYFVKKWLMKALLCFFAFTFLLSLFCFHFFAFTFLLSLFCFICVTCHASRWGRVLHKLFWIFKVIFCCFYVFTAKSGHPLDKFNLPGNQWVERFSRIWINRVHLVHNFRFHPNGYFGNLWSMHWSWEVSTVCICWLLVCLNGVVCLSLNWDVAVLWVCLITAILSTCPDYIIMERIVNMGYSTFIYLYFLFWD